MKRMLLTGNAAAAWGARLAAVDYVPAFPITPQTEIIEMLSEWMDKGEMPGRLNRKRAERLPSCHCQSLWRVPMVSSGRAVSIRRTGIEPA